jgi:prophage antirepressor
VKFQNWVFNEVLPSIRKTGSYSVRPMTHIQMLAAQAQAMAELEQRLNETENKVEQLVTIQEENLKQLNKLPLMQEEVPSFTPRQELNQMVRTYALSANLKYNEVWNKIYSELYYRYHISLNAYKKEKGENNLDIAEKIGAIDKLKIVVSNLLRELGTVKPLVKK